MPQNILVSLYGELQINLSRRFVLFSIFSAILWEICCACTVSQMYSTIFIPFLSLLLPLLSPSPVDPSIAHPSPSPDGKEASVAWLCANAVIQVNRQRLPFLLEFAPPPRQWLSIVGARVVATACVRPTPPRPSGRPPPAATAGQPVLAHAGRTRR